MDRTNRIFVQMIPLSALLMRLGLVAGSFGSVLVIAAAFACGRLDTSSGNDDSHIKKKVKSYVSTPQSNRSGAPKDDSGFREETDASAGAYPATSKRKVTPDLFAEFAKLPGKRVENVTVVTPGERQEAAVAEALIFLRTKRVETRRFTHGVVLPAEENWEVTLFELAARPRFGGYEYWIHLRKKDFAVSDWGQNQ
ncbi:MAG: hypothetical protein QM784_39470 [Polyangiaceae bacterium]